MDPGLVSTGIWPFILLVSAPLTALVSFFLLWLYRRAILRGMSAEAGAAAPLTPPLGTGGAPAPAVAPLDITIIDYRDEPPLNPEAEAAYRDSARSLRRLALAYAAAGLAYAAILAAAWMLIAVGGFYPIRFLTLSAYYAWPIVLALGLIAALGRRDQLAIAGVYLAVLVVISLLGLAFSSGLRLGELIFLWLWLNGPATLLLLAFLMRRVRAVGPLVLAFVVMGVAGSLFVSELPGHSEGIARAVVHIGLAMGLGASEVYLALMAAGFVALALVGWRLLRWLGRRYQGKRTSDQALTLDAMWLFFALAQPITLASFGPAWIFTGLVAFVAYKLVVRAGFVLLLEPPAGRAESPELLLLRVFSLGRRSQRLFDRLSQRWLRLGSISLIAGPDLVTAIVEPHEFLDFVGGRLSRQFVTGRADLAGRLAGLDTRPDPDGRHRVNEFFCRADTWQMTMRRLAARSDSVLMDLRSFSPANQGCLYELEQLLRLVPLERVMLLIDDTTDRPFLEQTLQAMWQWLPAEAPDRGRHSAPLRLFQAASGSPAEVSALLRHLIASARPAAPLSGAVPSAATAPAGRRG